MSKKTETPENSTSPAPAGGTQQPASPAILSKAEQATPPGDESPAVPIAADELALPLNEGMPTPTGAEVTPPASQEPFTPAPTVEIRDVNGTLFDPTKHRKDEFGNPVRQDGRFLSNRGRKKGGTNKTTDANATLETEEKPNAEDFVNKTGIPDQYDTGAEMLLQTAYGVAAMFLSDGIRPENDAEHTTLKVPLAAVLREKQTVQLTPTQLLLFSLAAYIGKKAGNPTVKDRAILLYIKIKGFFGFKTQPKQVQ